jgi:hypothetical protein
VFNLGMKSKPKWDIQKYIDQPWKLFLWVVLGYQFIAGPLSKILKYSISDASAALSVMKVLSVIIFILVTALSGYLYCRFNNRALTNDIRLRVTLYVAIYYFCMYSLMVIVSRGLFMSWLGAILATVLFSAAAYVLLFLGYKIWSITQKKVKKK